VTGYLNIYAHDVTIRFMTLFWYARAGSYNLRFYQNRTPAFFVASARGILIEGGEVGPNSSGIDGGQIKVDGAPGASAPRDITIQGVWFRDIARPPGSGLHSDCLQVGSAVNLTIANSRFTNCAVADILIRSWGASSPLTNIRLEGNTFARTVEGFYSVQIWDDLAPAPGSFTVVNNTCGQRMLVQVRGTVSSWGNVAC
jgi:hypothetical protein